MSDADTPQPTAPEQPSADLTAPLPDLPVAAAAMGGPIDEAAPVADVAHATSPQFAPPAEPVEAPHPTEQFSTSQFPTSQFPTSQFSAAEAPATAMPAMAPAPSSVVLGSGAPSAPKKKGVLAWALAGVATIAAIVFAILWVGKSGDADDLTAERDQLVLEKSTVVKMLETAEADLETAKTDLDNASSDLDAAQGDVDELQAAVDEKQAEVDDLTSQLEEAQSNQGGGGPERISDDVALRLGQALSSDADPPLTDAENICLGQAVYQEVGFELFVEIGFTTEPTDAQINQLVQGLFRATNACDLDISRLNP